jgi:phenylpyruvate tautomerase PptA (4-oxalocrotonate tautomerase family)
MPFIRSTVKKGTTPEQKKAIVDGVHKALIDSIGMPIDELFNLISEYDPQDFFYDRKFGYI